MLNKVCLIGNIGKDPEIRVKKNGKDYIIFSLATSKKVGETSVTQWHYVTVFSESIVALFKKFNIRKGQRLYLEGSLEYTDYEKNGAKLRSTNIIISDFAHKLLLLGDKTKDNNNSSVDGNTNSDSILDFLTSSQPDDDIPY